MIHWGWADLCLDSAFRASSHYSLEEKNDLSALNKLYPKL